MANKMLPYDSVADAETSPTSGDGGNAFDRESQVRSLNADADWREAAVRRENQRMELRSKAYEQAVAVCLTLFVYLFAMAAVVWSSDGDKFASEAQLAIFGTPIVAIAAITIFVLRGVFNGFSEKSVAEDTQALSQLAQNGSNLS